AALDRIFACLVAGGAGAFLNALKHHVVRKHGTGGLRGVFQGRLIILIFSLSDKLLLLISY
uniref:hypothetical protein n=1 Tax=Xanthomonas euvesicatoria TaxID=456327 RepID=UPI0038923CF3